MEASGSGKAGIGGGCGKHGGEGAWAAQRWLPLPRCCAEARRPRTLSARGSVHRVVVGQAALIKNGGRWYGAAQHRR